MKEELPIGPPGVVARLIPGALGEGIGHCVELLMGHDEVGSKPGALRLEVAQVVHSKTLEGKAEAPDPGEVASPRGP